jgi:diguanylate cyclase
MLHAFIINMSILISFTYFWHQLFRNHRLTLDSPYMIKISDGIIAGLLGILLMHYSIQVNDITLLDLRHIPVLLVAYYGGVVPSLAAAIIISIGRFQIAINESSVASLFMMLLIALGAAYLRHLIRGGIW